MSETTKSLVTAGAAIVIAGILAGSYIYVETNGRTASRPIESGLYDPPIPTSPPSYAPKPVAQLPSPNQPKNPIVELESAYASPAQSLPINALNNPQTASQILQLISKLGFVEGKTKPVAGKQYAYIFFDPRCPYCHKAYTELDGIMPIRWIPIPLLGDDPVPLSAALLASPSATNLDAAFSSGLIPTGPIKLEAQQALLDNVNVFKTLMVSLKGQGVPILLIPRTDGTIYTQIGYDDGDGKKILEAYGR